MGRNMNAIPVPQLALDPTIEGLLAEMAAKEQEKAEAAKAQAVPPVAPETPPAAPKAQEAEPVPAPAPKTPDAPLPAGNPYALPPMGGGYDPGMQGGIMPMMGNPYSLPSWTPVEIPEPPKRNDEERYAQIEALMRNNRPYKSFGEAVKANWLPMALVGGLSLLSNGRRGLAGVGQAGLDALSGLAGAARAREMQQQQLIQNALKLQGLRDEAAQRDQNEKYRYAALGLQAQDHAMNRALQEGQLGVAQGNLMMRMNEEARRQNDRAMLGRALFGGGFGMGGGLMPGGVPQPAPGVLPARQPGQNLPMANNNPLNLRHGGISERNGGMAGHGNFAYFPTPEQGARAAMENLQTPRYMAADGTGSIAQIAPMWVEGHNWPPRTQDDAAFWNANPAKLKGVQEYIQNVAQASGFDPNARINLKDPASLARLTAAMGKWEGFQGDPGVFQRAAFGQMPQAAPSRGGLMPAGQMTPEMLQQRKRAALAMMASGDEGMRAAGRAMFEEAGKAEAASRAKFQDDNGLGKRYEAQSENYMTMARSHSNILEAAKEGTGAGDLSLVFSFMKVLDPNSVVREGEQMMARKTGGAADQYVNLFNSIKNGQTLTPQQRRNFVKMSQKLLATSAREQAKRDEHYRAIAQRYNIDPDSIVFNPYQNLDAETEAYLKATEEREKTPPAPRMGGQRAGAPAGLPPDARPIN